MKKLKWQIILGIILIAASALLYLFHYLIFKDAHHIFLYLVGDIAFVPIEVLLVTLIIHKLLEQNEKRKILEKLNMVVGVFFSETGTELLKIFTNLDPNLRKIKEDLRIKDEWNEKEFDAVSKRLKIYDYSVKARKSNLEKLAILLKSKREFLIKLLENPILLEHESFTLLLRALFHLEEEFSRRFSLAAFTKEDQAHIITDIVRAYKLLACQWIEYTRYLKKEYPYLFQFAIKTNPFN